MCFPFQINEVQLCISNATNTKIIGKLLEQIDTQRKQHESLMLENVKLKKENVKLKKENTNAKHKEIVDSEEKGVLRDRNY